MRKLAGSVLGAIAMIGGVACMQVASAAASTVPNAETVVFSGSGHGTFAGKATSFRFSVSCQERKTGKPQSGVCSGGSMSFTSLSLVRNVKGTMVEGRDDHYTMTVSSSDGAVRCVLSNVTPITSGATNTIKVSCSKPSGTGKSTKASVTVETGP
jgi:hypothetical protein